MKTVICYLLAFHFFILATAQDKQQTVYTIDIDNFWKAYDSARKAKDTLQQQQIIQKLYIDKGTRGLKAFMAARDYTAAGWVRLINRYPKFWNSIRANTLAVKQHKKEIQNSIEKLEELYPSLKPASMYFTIGALRSGGTITEDMVLVGAEIATGTSSTVVSEFNDPWLKDVFSLQKPGNIVPLNLHEYVHTQQIGEAENLIGQSIREGACDFITELVMGKPLVTPYLEYGRKNEAALKKQFMEDMFTTAYIRWMYNGANAGTVADLGYFMGYAICKSFYNRMEDKKKAVAEIIELNYDDTAAVEDFLKRSGYYEGGVNKQQLVLAFQQKRPVVLSLEPFKNGDQAVDPGVREITIRFSAPMNMQNYSISFGERGKEYSPIVGVAGYTVDGTGFRLKIDLEPKHEYEFVITDRSFQSADGYPLMPSTVRFRTR
ncbi:MAG: hypothetical protein EOO04_29950 [Chitinophagaceae bacterium]|nr:MAG: hypothetical protein EOO04_29950 [Chitinophagaceae bacterium]